MKFNFKGHITDKNYVMQIIILGISGATIVFI